MAKGEMRKGLRLYDSGFFTVQILHGNGLACRSGSASENRFGPDLQN